MTREEAKKMAELMTAYAEGKTIQKNQYGNRDYWVDLTNPLFKEPASSYRIKPELKEYYILEHIQDGMRKSQAVHDTLHEARLHRISLVNLCFDRDSITITHVREVETYLDE